MISNARSKPLNSTGPKSPHWVALFLLLLFGALPGCHSPGERLDETEGVEALVQDWVEMWNSYDLDQVSRLFLNDPRLTYFSSEKEGVIRGMDAMLEHHRGFGFVSGGDERPSRLWVEDLEVDLFGDAALITGIWYFQSDSTSDAPPQKGPVTFFGTKSQGSWCFAHMNFSEYPPPDPLPTSG